MKRRKTKTEGKTETPAKFCVKRETPAGQGGCPIGAEVDAARFNKLRLLLALVSAERCYEP